MESVAGSREKVVLEGKGLTKYFGGLAACVDIDFAVNKGEILGIIGPNGAGKTTAFNLIVGYYRPTRGKVLYHGRDITGTRPDPCAKMGIVRMSQANTSFQELTVLENILVAYHLQRKTGFFGEIARLPSARRQELALKNKAMELLKSLYLDDVYNNPPGSLPHGQQRFLGLGMAMATEPEVLLLDEPTAGLTASETERVLELIKRIRDTGIAILYIEHNVKAIMGTSDRVLVMNFGQKIAEGKPEEIARDPKVVEAYLGAEYVA